MTMSDSTLTTLPHCPTNGVHFLQAMAKSVGGIVLFLLAAALPLTLHADESLMKTLADSELVDILQSDGYRAVERVDERVIKIKIDGHTYALYIYDDEDLQLYFGLTGYVLTNEHMNDWNRGATVFANRLLQRLNTKIGIQRIRQSPRQHPA